MFSGFVDCKPVSIVQAECTVDRKHNGASTNSWLIKAEAVDEEGIWCPCTVKDVSNDSVIVLFDGWNAEWNCRIYDPREIRN